MKYRKLLVPEWQKLYIEYQGLKQCLIVTKQVQIRIKEAKMQDRHTYDTVREQFINNYDLIKKLKSDNQRFIVLINQEIQILETFILFKYQDLKNKIQLLQNQGAKMKSEYVNIEDMHKQSIQSLSIKSNILRESFYEYYNQALQLQRYLYVNRMLLQTIIVKYHKYTFKEIKNIDCIQTSQLMMDVEILSKIEYKVKSLISQVSNLLIVYFYPFDQDHGLNSLLKYKQFKKTKYKTSFLIGLFAGVGIIVISLMMMLRYQGLLDPKDDKIFSPLFPCFRGVGLFILYYWLLTIDQIMWTQYQINYRLFLGFNHHFSTVPDVLKRVSFFSALYLILFLIYCFQAENITATFNIFSGFSEYFPLILWILLLGYVLIPTKSSFNGKGRKWMFKMFYGALIYHAIQYEGRYTFVLDQFVSLWTPLRDLEYTICYYYSHWSYNNQEYNDYQHCYQQQRIVSDICMISVFSLKCLHCLSLARKNKKFYKTNEMWNFLKNSLAVSVGLLSFLTKMDKMSAYIWMLFATTFTLVQYWWELNKDWLFFEKDSKIKFLRNDLGYHNPNIYYILAVINLFVSSTWALTVTPAMYEYFHITNSEIFIFILGAMELMRRFIHNLFKVEKEHICNIRNFKASKEIIFPFEASLDVSGLKIRNFRLSGDAGSLRASLAYDFRRISMDQQQTKSIPNRMTNITAEQLKQLDRLLAQPYDIMLIQEISKKQRISGDLQSQNDHFVQLIKQK